MDVAINILEELTSIRSHSIKPITQNNFALIYRDMVSRHNIATKSPVYG